MIDIKALRIGNSVNVAIPKWDHDGYVPSGQYKKIEVESICDSGINTYDLPDYTSQRSVSFNDIFGIELTPEILARIGFIKDTDRFTNKEGFSIFLRPEEFQLWYPSPTSIFTQFKNLHQLQNLYFALTGEELTYTP